MKNSSGGGGSHPVAIRDRVWRSMSDQIHSPSEERRIREAALDETLANTFPASDPPSSIPNPYDEPGTLFARGDRGGL